jgi:hypothetical protein
MMTPSKEQPTYPKIEDSLKNYVTFMTRMGNNVTRFDMELKARALASSLTDSSFKFSDSWLTSFCKRHEISFSRPLQISTGSKLRQESPCISSAINEWMENLPALTEGYSSSDIFNIDEIGIYYKKDTCRNYVSSKYRSSSGKKRKSRISVLLGLNAAGSEKLPLLIVTKSHQDQKNIRMLKFNRSGWLTTEIFHDYMINVDEKMRKNNRKILVFLDNCAIHRRTLKHQGFTNVKCVPLPALTTSFLQPIDLGISKVLKQFYHEKLLDHLTSNLKNNNKCVANIPVPITNVVKWLRQSWKQITPEVVINSFQKAGFDVKETCQEDLATECSVASYNGSLSPREEEEALDAEKGANEPSLKEFISAVNTLQQSSLPENLKVCLDDLQEYVLARTSKSNADE